MRKRRSGVEDNWLKRDGTPSAKHGQGSRWKARYVDDRGRENQKNFARKLDAQRWLDQQTTALGTGRHVAPRDAQITVAQWCEQWLTGYRIHRPTTVATAENCVARIVAEFGDQPLSTMDRPLMIKAWTAKLRAEGLADSTVYLLYRKLSQILSDACHEGLLGHNPCCRRISPPRGRQKPYVATTEQVWALHDAMPEHLKVAILLGAFAGLRVAEAAGLRVADVEFMRKDPVVYPKQQWKRGHHGGPGAPLKTDGSSAPIPISRELADRLSASVARYGTDMMVTNGRGRPAGPYSINEAIRAVRDDIDGLPEGFSYHDLRHYFASMLIASGVGAKVVQASLRHATMQTTFDTYGHLFPDADESVRAAIGKVINDRFAAGGG
jgi:integrase